MAWDAAAALDGDDPDGPEAAPGGRRRRGRRPRRLRRRGQGLHPGARRHRLHLGARRPPLPAAGPRAAPAVRRRVAVAGGRGRAARWAGPGAASRLDLPDRGRGRPRPRSGRSSTRSRRSRPSEQRAPAGRRRATSCRTGRRRGAATPAPVEQLVIDQELRRARRPRAAPRRSARGRRRRSPPTARPSSRSAGCGPRCSARSPGASCSASRRPAPTWPSLTTPATRTDGGWLLNGQKVWTSMAAEADWGICLARTNPTAPKHLGITYFVVDMATPGIDIRPAAGDHRPGDVQRGVPRRRVRARRLRDRRGRRRLAAGPHHAGQRAGVDGQRLVVRRRDRGAARPGGRAHRRRALDAPTPCLLDELGGAGGRGALGRGARRCGPRPRSLPGAEPGPEASVRKLLGVEHDQRTQELGLPLLGPEGATTDGAAGSGRSASSPTAASPSPAAPARSSATSSASASSACPRDPEPRSADLMAELLPDQLRLMAEALPDEVGVHRRRRRTGTSPSREWEARLEPAGPLARRRRAWPRATGWRSTCRRRRARPFLAHATRPCTRPGRSRCRPAPAWSPASWPTCSPTPARSSRSPGATTRRTLARGPAGPARAAHGRDHRPRGGRRAWWRGTTPPTPTTRPSRCRVGGDDMADLMYTSGTTGRPKGVVVRHRNVAMVPNGLPRWSAPGWLHASPMFTFAGIASDLQPDEARACGCSTCPASTSTAGSTWSSSAARPPPSSCRPWPSC